ncbi:hypothetical protein D3C73_807730 [compost metagenome]
MQVATHHRLVGHVIQTGCRVIAQVLGNAFGHGRQPGAVLGRDHQRHRARLGNRRHNVRRVALQDDVGVGAAETERVDPHHQRAVRLEGVVAGGDVEVELVERNTRVEVLDADGGRHLALGDAVQRLHQAGHAGRGLQVTDVALDRTDQQRLVRAAHLAQGQADGPAFDGVAHRGTGAVGFQVIDVGRRDPGTGVGLGHQRCLRIGAGHGQPGLAPVGIDRTAGDDGEDLVAIGHRLVVILEVEQPCPFGTHVTVTGFVEDVAAPFARQHRGLGEDQETERVQVQADTAGQCLVDIAALNGLAGLVERDQRRGTRGIDRHARAMQVIEVRQAIGRDAEGVARGCGSVHQRQVMGQAIGIVGAGNAQVHPAVAAAHARRFYPGVLEHFPAQLQ